MEVNNHDQIIYPQNLKKFTGYVQEVRSRSKNGNKKVISFRVRIRSLNFKYYKCFPSRQEAEADLIRQNIKNKLEIKNILRDCGDYYAVRLSNRKEFLADKSDLHIIESYAWRSNRNYVVTHQNNKPNISFHNLILGHNPTSNSTVNHINQNPLDNRRSNLRIATNQIQNINRTPKYGTNQPFFLLGQYQPITRLQIFIKFSGAMIN